jgi:hypothetical protein
METKIAFIALLSVVVIAVAALNINGPPMGTAAGINSFEHVECPRLYNIEKMIEDPMPAYCTYALQGKTISNQYMCCNPSLEPQYNLADSKQYSL